MAPPRRGGLDAQVERRTRIGRDSSERRHYSGGEMKQFCVLRKKGDIHRHATIVELSFWDIARLLLGREIEIWPLGEVTMLRAAPAYDAFNGEALPDARP
jgi:hypothetical protein